MNKAFLKRNWQIIVCNLVLLVCFIIGYGRFGDIIVDSFREAYIPSQVLAGKALYKDIFVIYPPLAYLINSFLFFVFGIKLKVLYFAGFIATIGIINLTFKTAAKFIHKTHALGIVLFIISAAALSPNVFNLFFPYSFGALYGILFALGSIYCVINRKYTAAYFLYSLALCSKYEFILFLPLLIWTCRKNGFVKSATAFLAPILFTITTLVIQGVGFKDILANAEWIFIMSSTKTLYWFYSVSGLVFRPQLIPIYILNFIKYFIPLLFVYYFRSIWTVILLIIYLCFAVNPEILIYVFPLILILFGYRFRYLSKRKLFFISASLLISIKLFFALTLQSYGIYFLPFALISLFILTPKKYKKSLFILILCASAVIAVQNINTLMKKNVKIKTDRGVVYTTSYYGNSINKLVNYIEKNTDKEDTVLVLPEGTVVNFLTGRKSDNKFYSQIPLYIETFGDKLIVERLKFKTPKYIVITDYNTSNYYYSFYGLDYAGEVLEYIHKNYIREVPQNEGLETYIYKKK